MLVYFCKEEVRAVSIRGWRSWLRRERRREGRGGLHLQGSWSEA